MTFFGNLAGCSNGGETNRYQSEQEFQRTRSKQIAMAPQTLAQLHKHGVTNETRLKLEYFFYTNLERNAAALADEMKKMGYDGSYRISAHDAKLFLINGWTTRLPTDEKAVVDWTAQMCDLGRKYDCEFDGWGTIPDQTD